MKLSNQANLILRLALIGITSLATYSVATAMNGKQFLFDRPLSYELIHSDSGISRRPLTTIHQEFADLAAANSGVADWIQYGNSGRGKPLMVLRVMNKALPEKLKRPAVLISEGIHGNEYLHITDRLPFEFLKAKGNTPQFENFIATGGVVYFVPIMNPDGYSAGQRGNASGADLNRDFKIQAAGNDGFRQPETRSITTFVANEVKAMNLTVEATMEYHCCIGGLIHPWAWTPEGLTGEPLARHQAFGEMVKDILGYPYGTVNDILGYSAVGGSDDYYLETYGRRAFSLEGQRTEEAKRLAEHVKLWERFFAELQVTGETP